MEKVIIIGTGCAGLTAAIYTARSNLKPLVLEGREPGGQLTTTTMVENFPGFPEGINGPDLIMSMHKQAEKFGARFEYAEVEEFEPGKKQHRVKIGGNGGQWIETESLIISSGAAAKWLGFENEVKMKGHGLTSCATCDGAFYRDVPVAVIGGGDTACEEATFLTRFASKVYLIHRRDSLRASLILAQRATTHPKVEIIWDTVVTEYMADGSGEMNAIKLKNIKTDETSELEVKCVFVAIGHVPNTKPFKGKLDMDEEGYLLRKKGTSESNVSGVFIAGDVQDRVYRQAITAAGQGCAAALDAERYIENIECNNRT